MTLLEISELLKVVVLDEISVQSDRGATLVVLNARPFPCAMW